MSDRLETPRRSPLWLKILYVVLAVAAIALLTMLLKALIQWAEGETGEIHHLPVFDIAWFVFVPSGGISLLAAIVLFPVGLVRKDPRLTRYCRWVAVVIAVAVVGIVASELTAEPPPSNEHGQHDDS
ncbi:MAG TPA: hypothetical protein VFB74_24515 [Kribbellaceae bacterium]|nr:hypothetical protein [Kribbellaceae bacterium]